MNELSEGALVTTSDQPLPAIVLDARAPGGLEAAVHGALQAAGLRQEMVAIVLVPLGSNSLAWSPRSLDQHGRDAGDGLVIDGLAHEVSLHGEPVILTTKEFALLYYLYQRRGVVITRLELLRDVWGERYGGGPRTVDIHVRRLRKKLGADWLETTRGVGYKFRRRRDG